LEAVTTQSLEGDKESSINDNDCAVCGQSSGEPSARNETYDEEPSSAGDTPIVEKTPVASKRSHNEESFYSPEEDGDNFWPMAISVIFQGSWNLQSQKVLDAQLYFKIFGSLVPGHRPSTFVNQGLDP
jgi:hypothetical protein